MKEDFFSPAETAAASKGSAQILDVPYIDQRELWPTGCESVSTVMVLQYLGVKVTVDEFIDEYLPRGKAPSLDADGKRIGGDPRKVFPGDPRTPDGWGCYVPVLREAVARLARARENVRLSTVDLSGRPLEELVKNYVNQGMPVLLWATIDMAAPNRVIPFLIEGTEEIFNWVSPQHCLVLVGGNEAGYYFNDPLAGKAVFYDRAAVQLAYEGLHTQAMIITKAS